ncbi:MAG: 30S ribosomal protein S17 [Candidatus Omnitrophota bacterium]
MLERGKRKERVGIVVSDKMKKTIIVKVKRLAGHSKYSKVVRRYRKFKVHDEENKAKVGQLVRIAETRRLSKDKRWRLVDIIK